MVAELKKRGRPRKHANNAAKQKAYNRRKQQVERDKLVTDILNLIRIPKGNARAELDRLTLRRLKDLRRRTRLGQRMR